MERLGRHGMPINVRPFRSENIIRFDRLGGIKDDDSPQLTLSEFTKRIFDRINPGKTHTKDEMMHYVSGHLDDDLNALYETYTNNGSVYISTSSYYFVICDVRRGIKGAIYMQIQDLFDRYCNMEDIRFLLDIFNEEGLKQLDKLNPRRDFTVPPNDYELRLTKLYQNSYDIVPILIEHNIYGQDLVKLCERLSYDGCIYGDERCVLFNV